MKPVSPVIPDKNLSEVIVAEHQDEYRNLPAVRLENGVILCRWKLDEDERRRVAETGDIYLLQWTGGGSVTPILLQVEPPDIEPPKPVEPLPQMMAAARRSAKIVNEAKRHGFEIFEDNCSDCTCVVVYTSATKETLRAAPETKVVCTVCFAEMKRANEDLQGVYLPNTNAEMERVRKVLEERKENGDDQ